MKKLGFGLMRLPITEEGNPKSIDLALVNNMVDYFLEQGFVYFDTAYGYHQGTSEEAARKALVERHPRDSFVLASKMPTWLIKNSSDYQTIFDTQLQRCGVEYFDYYLLHNLGKANYTNSVKHGGFAYMQKLKREGKARNIGFSFHDTAELLDTILTEHPEMEFVQLQINYADWDNGGIQSRKCYEVAVKHGKPVIVMEPVKGGSLAALPPAAMELMQQTHPTQSAAAWALRFAASLENVFMVLSGMSNWQQITENTQTMSSSAPLSSAEQEIIAKVRDILNQGDTIPCTTCRYCVDECPQHIAIPEYFSLFNNQSLFGLVLAHNSYYENLAETHGKAASCIACKRCEAHCPQHIAISDALKRVSAIFDKE